MRFLLSIATAILVTGCSLQVQPPPGRLVLSNYRFAHAHLQVAVTAAAECGDPSAAAAVSEIDLPLNATRVIDAAPGADICWRHSLEATGGSLGGGGWSDWRRVFTATGRSIDSQL